MTASAYVNILLDVVATLQDTVGVGGTVRALRLGHAMAPEGVTEYDASLRIAELTNSARAATERGAQVLAVSATENGVAFLQQLRQERLRQASTSFNAALIILTVGTLIVLAGAILLFTQRVKTGTLTAAAGVIANITSGLVFRFSHNANDRLDKLARGIGKLEGTKRTIRLLEAQTERH
jgi:Zn-dependent membrane protease YugP